MYFSSPTRGGWPAVAWMGGCLSSGASSSSSVSSSSLSLTYKSVEWRPLAWNPPGGSSHSGKPMGKNACSSLIAIKHSFLRLSSALLSSHSALSLWKQTQRGNSRMYSFSFWGRLTLKLALGGYHFLEEADCVGENGMPLPL